MGRIIGFVFTTAAIVSLIQYPLAVATTSTMSTMHYSNPFEPVNWLLAGVCLFPISATVWYEHTNNNAPSNDTDDTTTNTNTAKGYVSIHCQKKSNSEMMYSKNTT
jgi:hypothetical protein